MDLAFSSTSSVGFKNGPLPHSSLSARSFIVLLSSMNYNKPDRTCLFIVVTVQSYVELVESKLIEINGLRPVEPRMGIVLLVAYLCL